MGKMPAGKAKSEGRARLLQGSLEILDLSLWESVKEGLKQYDGFAKARVQVVVHGIEKLPVTVRLDRIATR